MSVSIRKSYWLGRKNGKLIIVEVGPSAGGFEGKLIAKEFGDSSEHSLTEYTNKIMLNLEELMK